MFQLLTQRMIMPKSFGAEDRELFENCSVFPPCCLLLWKEGASESFSPRDPDRAQQALITGLAVVNDAPSHRAASPGLVHGTPSLTPSLTLESLPLLASEALGPRQFHQPIKRSFTTRIFHFILMICAQRSWSAALGDPTARLPGPAFRRSGQADPGGYTRARLALTSG